MMQLFKRILFVIAIVLIWTGAYAAEGINVVTKEMGGNTTDVTLDASATTGGMSLSGQEISNQAATTAQNGYATSTQITTLGSRAASGANADITSLAVTKLTLDSGTDATLDVAASTHYGGIAVNGDADAIEMDLDAAVAGMSMLILDGAGGAITLDPNGTDTIVYEGTAAAAGEALISSGAKGDTLSIVCVVANQWLVIGHDVNGWTEASP